MKSTFVSLAALAAAVSPAVSAPAPQSLPLSPVAHPALWPAVKAQPPRDPAIERRIDGLLARMNIEDKVGQLIQVDIGSITPADVRTYKLGSVLNGGNSGPYGDDFAPAPKWLALADEYYDASMARSDGRPQIPIIWGTDSVHGNNNIPGATIFPHNIGLGAARDRDLIRKIGEVTAIETAAAGLDWTFAPTLAVVQDDRWGRTYESYSEEPAIPIDYAGAMIEGVQGKVGTKDFLSPTHVIATTKHFLGDGGTGGRDQGDAQISEEVLRDVHLGGYPAALEAGTQSVMASFLELERRQDERQQEPADRCAQAPDGLRRFRRRRLEQPWPGGGLLERELPAGDQCRAGHVHVFRPRLEKTLPEHARRGALGRDPGGPARRCRAAHPARQAACGPVRARPALDAGGCGAFRADRCARASRHRAAGGAGVDGPAEE
jgi:hypothetical protein